MQAKYNKIITAVNLNPNDIIKKSVMDMMIKFENLRVSNPKSTQDQICKMMNISSSSLRRYRNDLKMDSPYRMGHIIRKAHEIENRTK